jgi:hypothetical protein
MLQTTTVDLPAVYPHPVRIEWKHLAATRVETPNVSVSELAKLCGRTPQTIYIWLKLPLYQAYETWVFQQRRAEWTPYETARELKVETELSEYSGEMLERLRLIAESTQDEKLAASVAQDWLDRAGYVPAKKAGAGSPQIVLTEGAMRVLLERDRESRGSVVVGEVVEGLSTPRERSA